MALYIELQDITLANQDLSDNKQLRSDSLTFGAIAAGIAFVMELTLLPLLLSAIGRDLALSLVELAWVYNAYAIAVAVAVLCSGLAGDVLDKRRLFMVGVVLFAVGSILTAFSNDLHAMVASRIVQGIGGGLFFPLVPILLTQANAEQTGKILMIWGALSGFAAAVLPIFGAPLLTGFGWPAILIVIAAVSTLGWLFVVLGHPGKDAARPGGVPDYRKLLLIRGYWLLLSYVFLTYGCFSYYLFHMPISWHRSEFSGLSVAFLLTCVWLTFSVVSFLLRDGMDGIGLNRALLVAPTLFALSFVVAALDQGSPQNQIVSAAFAGSGLACCNSPSTHLLLRVSPKDLRATSSSLDIIFARCGGVAIVAVLAILEPQFELLAIATFLFLATNTSYVFLKELAPPA